MSRIQVTLALLKPDLLIRPSSRALRAEILGRAKERELDLVAWRRFDPLGVPLARSFYAEHGGRFFYPRLVFTMASGPVEALLLRGPDAIARWRALLGPTHLWRARSPPHSQNTLRGAFARSDTRNVAHGSDSEASAQKELLFFFPELARVDPLGLPALKHFDLESLHVHARSYFPNRPSNLNGEN